MLKPQDIVILLKKISLEADNASEPLTQNQLALFLLMSPSQVNASIHRLLFSKLIVPICKDANSKITYWPDCKSTLECLMSLKYFFPVKLGTYVIGIATSYASPLLEKHIILGDDPIPVWPYHNGAKKGLALEPLYHTVPASVKTYPDNLFYELLTLVDVLRNGRARERNIATELLNERLNKKTVNQ